MSVNQYGIHTHRCLSHDFYLYEVRKRLVECLDRDSYRIVVLPATFEPAHDLLKRMHDRLNTSMECYHFDNLFGMSEAAVIVISADVIPDEALAEVFRRYGCDIQFESPANPEMRICLMGPDFAVETQTDAFCAWLYATPLMN